MNRPPDREGTRRIIGGVLYALCMLTGGLLLLLAFVLPAALHGALGDLFLGAVFALPPLAIYLWLPWIVDRYDPEPVWCLLAVLAWGAIASTGISAIINTSIEAVGTAVGGESFGSAIATCIGAPLVEEFWKGLGVFGVFMFLRREFDGLVDGIIYATFAALGFAALENVTYLARAASLESRQEGVFAATFVLRCILSPWGHPLYTSMTGIGFGLARERSGIWRFLGPFLGYGAAVALHAIWNTSATLSQALGSNMFFVMLPLWFLVVLAFFILVVVLVVRKGRIIRDHLKDEVLLGYLTPYELELVCSSVSRIKATMQYGGSAGREFVAAAARLGLCKWHAGRAMKGKKQTVSAEWIVPLRNQLGEIRIRVERSLGRPVQKPAPWQGR